MTQQPRIKDLAISENGFVFAPFSGGTFTLNLTGQAIVKALRDGLSEEEIVTQLSRDFEGATEKVHEDVQDFMRTLDEFGLLSDSE